MPYIDKVVVEAFADKTLEEINQAILEEIDYIQSLLFYRQVREDFEKKPKEASK